MEDLKQSLSGTTGHFIKLLERRYGPVGKGSQGRDLGPLLAMYQLLHSRRQEYYKGLEKVYEQKNWKGKTEIIQSN